MIMVRLLTTALGIGLLASACAPGATLSVPTFHDAQALRTEAGDWSGERTGISYLRRTYEVRVDVATRASKATSRIRAHLVRIAWDAEAAPTIPIAVPGNATLSSLQARVLGAEGVRPLAPTASTSESSRSAPDPDQVEWSLTFPPVPAGEALEVIADFDVPGTLATDARWVGAPDGPTGQLLMRYDVPTDAKATLQVRGADARPLLTKQDGNQVFAVFMRHVPPRRGERAHVRYVTIEASVRGYEQRFATSWSRIAAPYTKALLDGSAPLRMNHREPFRATEPGTAGVHASYLWVRDRLQRPDALEASWRQGRALPNLVRTNDLNATDKVHLLRWLLDAGGIEHRVAAVRSNEFAPIDDALPFPGAFDGAAVYIPTLDLWLDPACKSCEPGTVRGLYRGALGLLLPAGADAAPVRLPE